METSASRLKLVHRTAAAREGSEPYPALVLLHGIGSDELDLLGLTPQIDSSLFVISLRAPNAYGGYGYSWYDLSLGFGRSESLERSIDLVAGFLREMREVYPIDPARVYVGGFSQGAAMTLATSLLHRDLVAGSIALSGYLPPELPYPADSGGLPVFQAHGIHDPTVPVHAARLTRDALLERRVDLTYREFPIGHAVSEAELKELAEWVDRQLANTRD